MISEQRLGNAATKISTTMIATTQQHHKSSTYIHSNVLLKSRAQTTRKIQSAKEKETL